MASWEDVFQLKELGSFGAHRMRFTALLIVILLSSVTLATEATSEDLEFGVIVWDATADDLVDLGAVIVDDYSIYIHAKVSEAEADEISSLGYPIEKLPDDAPVSVASEAPGPDPATIQSPYAVVSFRGPPKSEWLEALSEQSSILESRGSFGVLVRLNSGTDPANVLSVQGVRSVRAISPDEKVSPYLADATNVTLFGDAIADKSQLVTSISSTGATIHTVYSTARHHMLRVTANATVQNALTLIPEILWIAPTPSGGTFDLSKASSVLQGGTEGTFSLHAQGLTGLNQKVMVCDNGVETIRDESYTDRVVISLDHVAFSDPVNGGLIEYNAPMDGTALSLPAHRKVGAYYSPVEDGFIYGSWQSQQTSGGQQSHGTRTANIIGGDKPTWGARDLYDGVAFNATLYICDIQRDEKFMYPSDPWSLFAPAFDRGVRIASFSYGSQTSTLAYTEEARSFDVVAWDHKNLTIVRSIGNIGQNGANPRPEALAKSTIAVGGTENNPCSSGGTCDSSGDIEKVSPYSTNGPASDGRIKPDVVAPGMCVYSAEFSGDYSCGAGTSYAAPAVAGVVALFREYFTEGYHPGGSRGGDSKWKEVNSSLMRGLLIASAKDLTNVTNPLFPSGEQGWGRVLADDVLHFAGETQKLLVLDEKDSATTASVWTRDFEVNSGGQLRVVVSWTDEPGSVLASKALVNDLDLRVIGPGCVSTILDNTCIGNAFGSGSAETVAGSQHPADRINPIEAVYLCRSNGSGCAVPTGTYTIRVAGHSVRTVEGQPFSVVITGDVEWAS